MKDFMSIIALFSISKILYQEVIRLTDVEGGIKSSNRLKLQVVGRAGGGGLFLKHRGHFVHSAADLLATATDYGHSAHRRQGANHQL